MTDISTALKILASVAASEGEGSKEQAVLELLTAYEEMAGEFRPIAQALPMVSDKVGADIAPIMAAFMGLASAMGEDPELKKARERFTAMKATNRFEAFQIHKTAGFTDEQAMALVLQDAAQPSILHQALSKVGGAVASKNSEEEKE